jgi:hypothetical protein
LGKKNKGTFCFFIINLEDLVMKKYCWSLLFILGGFQTSFSQTEEGIRKTEVPSVVIEFIDKNYSGHSHVKYYQEKIKDTMYYEAVFKKGADEYSLLFEKSGILYETEKTMPFKELPDKIIIRIEEYLKKEFVRYKVIEIQEVDLKGKLMYELSVKGKKQSKTSFYQIYFSRQGEFYKMEDTELKTIPSLF